MLAGEAGDGGGVEVHAVADAREVVHHDGQGAVGRDVGVEAVDDGGRGRLAEVRRRQHQDVVGAGVSGVGDELEAPGASSGRPRRP